MSGAWSSPPRSAAASTAIALFAPSAHRFVPSSGSTAISTSGHDAANSSPTPKPPPTSSPMKSIGASSRSPSPITIRPRIGTESITSRMASTATSSEYFRSPWPIVRAAAIAAASVTRKKSRDSSRSVLNSGAIVCLLCTGTGSCKNCRLKLFENERKRGHSSRKPAIAENQDEKDPAVARQKMKAESVKIAESARKKLEGQLSSLDARTNEILSPWFRFFLSYDPRPTLMKVHVPVLALNGEKDTQVPAREDLEAIEQALKDGGNPDYKIVLLPKLNHLFQASKTGSPSEYAEIEETIAPVALETMGDWIIAHTKN